MNIHRNPLCGRNFEYFSEDPLLTGKIAAAAVRGIAATGCSATIKHFCCNNQETSRSFGEAVVSQRALREIYLKGYEIAVKEGGAMSIMTSYTPVNGYWCASNYDLTTTILRNEWGFRGVVMTDWWAKANNCLGETCYKYNVKATVRAQNDLYMLSGDPENESNNNVLQGLEEGYITRGELQRCAKNILSYILQSVTFAKFYDGGCVKPDFNNIDDSKLTTVFKVDNVQRGKSYMVKFGGENETVYKFKIQYDAPDIAQTSVKFITDYSGFYLTVNGTGKNAVEYKRKSHYVLKEYSVSIEFGEGVTVTDFEIKC